jgi:hypothetical protein
MRVLAAVVLAGCSFHTNAATTTGDAAPDTSLAIDARSDAPPDATVTIDDAPPDALVLPADWWNPAWHSRIKLTVTNNAATGMARGYQVGLQLDLDAAPCTGSRDAVRIVYGMTEVSRVIDEVGGDEWTWFPLQAAIASAASDDYWLYCGNAAPMPAPSDPTMVFDFFDGFDGAALGAAWVSQNTVTVSGGSVTIASNGTGGGAIHSTATYGANTAIDFLATASTGAASDPYWWGGYETNFAVTQPWDVWYSDGSAANKVHPSEYDSNRQWNGTAVGLDTAPHIYGVEHYGTSGAYRMADAIVDSHTFTGTVGALNIRLHNYNSGGSISFDWARVRKAVSPAPSVATGTVETF